MSETLLRLRTPGKFLLKSWKDGVGEWTKFSAQQETVTIPAGLTGRVEVVARY